MSGIQEILVLIILVLAILIVPRILASGKDREGALPTDIQPWTALTGWMRLAVVVSVLWPLALALYLKPWAGNFFRFIYLGPGPVLIAWCAWWVKSGFRRYRR